MNGGPRSRDTSPFFGLAAKPRTYLDTEQAAAYVRAPNRKAFRQWAQRHNVFAYRRGRRLLFDQDDLDRALRPVHGHTLRRAG